MMTSASNMAAFERQAAGHGNYSSALFSAQCEACHRPLGHKFGSEFLNAGDQFFQRGGQGAIVEVAESTRIRILALGHPLSALDEFVDRRSPVDGRMCPYDVRSLSAPADQKQSVFPLDRSWRSDVLLSLNHA